MPRDRRGFRILVVDDDPDFGRLVAKVIEDAGFAAPDVTSTIGASLDAARDADLVLLDHRLPDGNGLSLLPALRSLPRQPAVILITGHGDEALAAGALRAGAYDYLIKDAALPSLLPEVVEHARRNRALQEALAAAERDLVHAERQVAIGQLAVAVSHSLNNPLMAAFAEADLLLGDAKLTSDQRASVAAIRDALERISETLGRISDLRHDQVTDYPGGLEMIDLSRRTRPTPVNAGDALLWLADESLARVVGSLLKHAGFNVERCADHAALEERARLPGVTVVVVRSNEFSESDPLAGFRPAADRRYTLVTLVAGSADAVRAAGADHVVALPFDPGTFTSDLLAAMRI